MQMPEWLKELLHTPLIVGLAGAVVGLRFSVAKTFGGRAWQVASGALIATYVAPAVVAWVKIDDVRIGAGVSFVTGCYGVVIASSVYRWLIETKVSDFLPLPKRRGDSDK